jgi:hypothetical protein
VTLDDDEVVDDRIDDDGSPFALKDLVVDELGFLTGETTVKAAAAQQDGNTNVLIVVAQANSTKRLRTRHKK